MRTRRTLAFGSLIAICLATAAPAASADAEPSLGRLIHCTPGEDKGCLPTPLECALGLYNGHWDGGFPGRFADCVGGAGHVVHYIGGYIGTDQKHPLCGEIIEADQTLAGGWDDPNICPPASAPPGYGVPGRALPPQIVSPHGVVAADSEIAAEAGIDALDRGGNAMDAAVTATFAMGVARPDICGIGGVGTLVYRRTDGETAALDFLATAPSSVTPDFRQDGSPGIDDLDTGHKVAGIPGVVAGLDVALRRYGTIGLANAIAPAEALARYGVPVAPEFTATYGALINIPGTPIPAPSGMRLRLFPETAKTFFKGGVLEYPPDNPMARSILFQPDLARSLALIAKYGSDAFYKDTSYPEGPSVGRLILRDMERARRHPMYPGDAPSPWNAADLVNYQAIWRRPLSTTYRGNDVYTTSATGGGYIVAETLNIMEGFSLGASIAHSSADYFHTFAEAHKLAARDMFAYFGDPAFVDIPTATLTSKAYADRRRAEIDLFHAKDYSAGAIDGTATHSPGSSPRSSSRGHTTSLSVIDEDGNAVALTCTMGFLLGNGVVTPGAGFALNDALSNFTAPGTANEARGGKRPRWHLSPTIVVNDGKAVLVTGAAGGGLIPLGVVYSISNTIDYGMDAAHALDAARAFEFCLQACPADGSGPGLMLEDGRVLPTVIAELERRGHALALQGEYAGFPHVEMVGTDPTTGLHVGASDPRSPERGARS